METIENIPALQLKRGSYSSVWLKIRPAYTREHGTVPFGKVPFGTKQFNASCVNAKQGDHRSYSYPFSFGSVPFGSSRLHWNKTELSQVGLFLQRSQKSTVSGSKSVSRVLV